MVVDDAATGLPDGELIRRIAAGDRQSVTDLYVRYQSPLFRYLLHLTPDRGVAEDVLQETFIAVWHGAPLFAGRSSVQAWLFGVARRQAHNALRRRGLPLVGEDALAARAAPDPDPADAVLATAAHDDLLAALRRLSPIQREVLTLMFVHDRSSREVAAILAIPLPTVKSRLHHAKRTLRALFEAHAEVEP